MHVCPLINEGTGAERKNPFFESKRDAGDGIGKPPRSPSNNLGLGQELGNPAGKGVFR